MPQAYISPAFTGNEKPSVPRQSMFGRLRALTLGLMFGTSLNCGSSTTQSAIDASPTTPIATIDSAVPTAAIDAMPNTGMTAADILLDMYKTAGILPQDATKLPNVMEYDSSNDTGVHTVEKLDRDNSNSNKIIYKKTTTGDSTYIPKSEIMTYTSDFNGGLNMVISKEGFSETLLFKITSNKNTGFMNFDSSVFGTYSLKKIATGKVGYFSQGNFNSPYSIDANWTNDGVLAMIPKKAEALAKRFGKVTHDLRTGELSVPISKGKVAVIADLAKKAHI